MRTEIRQLPAGHSVCARSRWSISSAGAQGLLDVRLDNTLPAAGLGHSAAGASVVVFSDGAEATTAGREESLRRDWNTSTSLGTCD